MRRWVLVCCWAWAVACGGEETPPEDAALTEDREVATEGRRPRDELGEPAVGDRVSHGTTPEFRLRLDPERKLVDVEIDVDVAAPDSVHLLFRADWEGYPGLEDRLRGLEAHGPTGPLDVLLGAGDLGTGHHIVPVPDPQRVTVAFSVALEPAPESRLYHRVSQLGETGGHLLAGDLLPRIWVGRPRGGPLPASVWFSGLPPDWRVATIEERAGNAYAVDDLPLSVFMVGRLRTRQDHIGPRTLTTAIHGAWPVSDSRVWTATSRIAGSLHRIAGDGWAAGEYLLGAGRVPSHLPGRTAGGQVIERSGIVYVGGNGSPEIEFQGWLHTTAHELMHWYIPIGFRFEGEPPAWFAEGFTDYMALKTLRVGKLIPPDEFLFEIGERLLRYRSSPLYDVRSVAEAQTEFWQADAYRYIYDGGTVAAFLLDLGFQDRGRALEQALRKLSAGPPITSERLRATLASIPENEWLSDWLEVGSNPDWDARLATYRLAWRDNRLTSLDDWATDVLSSIRP